MHKIYLYFLFITASSACAQNKVQPVCGHEELTDQTTTMENTSAERGKNVLGTDLKMAGTDPVTGYYRDGYCASGDDDRGVHVVAAVLTDAFLQFSKSKGNDLITPLPAYGFPGLKANDTWCLCAGRWKEAYDAGVAPPVILEATHEKALQFVTLKQLQSVK
jgi:uncharacterized protein